MTGRDRKGQDWIRRDRTGLGGTGRDGTGHNASGGTGTGLDRVARFRMVQDETSQDGLGCNGMRQGMARLGEMEQSCSE